MIRLNFNSSFLQQISVNLSVFRVHCYSVLGEQLPLFQITLHAKKGNINHIYGESFTKFIVNSQTMISKCLTVFVQNVCQKNSQCRYLYSKRILGPSHNYSKTNTKNSNDYHKHSKLGGNLHSKNLLKICYYTNFWTVDVIKAQNAFR